MCRFAAASPSKAARGGGGLLSNGHPAAAPAELEPQLLRRSSATLNRNANGGDTPQSARPRGPSRSDGALLACARILGTVHSARLGCQCSNQHSKTSYWPEVESCSLTELQMQLQRKTCQHWMWCT